MLNLKTINKLYQDIIEEGKSKTFFINIGMDNNKKRVARDVISVDKFPPVYRFTDVIILKGNTWQLLQVNKQKRKAGIAGPDVLDKVSQGTGLNSLHTASPLGYEAISKYL